MDERKVRDDKTHYRNAWEFHIDELALLALRAGADYSDFRNVRDILNGWLAKALERTK